jgi:hypothetical protein
LFHFDQHDDHQAVGSLVQSAPSFAS